MQISNCKMQIEILKFKNSYYGCEIAKKHSQIHSKRKSEDSQRSFGFERARKVDSRVISEIFETK
jgi:hypothetical protein